MADGFGLETYDESQLASLFELLKVLRVEAGDFSAEKEFEWQTLVGRPSISARTSY
jgi:hypothetical protein